MASFRFGPAGNPTEGSPFEGANPPVIYNPWTGARSPIECGPGWAIQLLHDALQSLLQGTQLGNPDCSLVSRVRCLSSLAHLPPGRCGFEGSDCRYAFPVCVSSTVSVLTPSRCLWSPRFPSEGRNLFNWVPDEKLLFASIFAGSSAKMAHTNFFTADVWSWKPLLISRRRPSAHLRDFYAINPYRRLSVTKILTMVSAWPMSSALPS